MALTDKSREMVRLLALCSDCCENCREHYSKHLLAALDVVDAAAAIKDADYFKNLHDALAALEKEVSDE